LVPKTETALDEKASGRRERTLQCRPADIPRAGRPAPGLAGTRLGITAALAVCVLASNATVKTHINRIFAKTGVRDRAQAVRYAYQAGLASPSA